MTFNPSLATRDLYRNPKTRDESPCYGNFHGIDRLAYSYDPRGNLTGDGVFTYAYDAESHLLNAAGTSTTATYAYDPQSRRKAKTVNGTTTNYLSAGSQEIAEYDGSGNLLRRYVYGVNLDDPLVTVDAAGNHSYHFTDAQGSVVALANASGQLAEKRAYSAYELTASTVGTAFQFTGRRVDPETGLYYYRARYYSPALGRFLQTDPIGTQGGINLYAYVGNDPVNLLDPLGLQPTGLMGYLAFLAPAGQVLADVAEGAAAGHRNCRRMGRCCNRCRNRCVGRSDFGGNHHIDC
jgi:RHS repeat-associated protein